MKNASISSLIFIQFVILALLLISCDKLNSGTKDRLIARAENHYLYLSDIEKKFNGFNSKEDSLIKVQSFINNWARKKIMYEKSLINLSVGQLSDLELLVENYRSNLFRTVYKESIIKSIIDTIIDQNILISFYNNNKSNFKLKEPLYRIKYLSFPLNNVDSRQIINSFKRFEEKDIDFLDSLSFQFSNYFMADSIWIKKSEVFNKVGIVNANNQDIYLKKTKYYEVKDTLELYLFQLVERLKRNEIAPLSHIESTIKNIVLNKRKIEFLRNFDNEILQDAIKIKKFETYP
jgi:hypothetical protein